jgi:REP element-mobilizing transposase RayT
VRSDHLLARRASEGQARFGVNVVAIAIFSTWTTYGTWLPGDDRGWFHSRRGWREPDQRPAFSSALRMRADAVTLTGEQRRLVEAVIATHSTFRSWELYAVNCRTNHVHVVVFAAGRAIEIPREQFKSWTNRRLREQCADGRTDWWTERGWDVYIDDPDDLAAVVEYVLDRQ